MRQFRCNTNATSVSEIRSHSLKCALCSFFRRPGVNAACYIAIHEIVSCDPIIKIRISTQLVLVARQTMELGWRVLSLSYRQST